MWCVRACGELDCSRAERKALVRARQQAGIESRERDEDPEAGVRGVPRNPRGTCPLVPLSRLRSSLLPRATTTVHVIAARLIFLTSNYYARPVRIHAPRLVN